MGWYSSGSRGWSVAFFLAGTAIIIWALFFAPVFIAATKAHPFLMGFMKLFVLGTCGEIIKCGAARRAWKVDYIFERAGIWGFYGIWFTWAFPAFAGVPSTLAAKHLWFTEATALSRSAWINLLGGYAFWMMIVHEYLNFLIRMRWKVWWLNAFADQVDRRFIFSFLPKTLLIWLALHTFTYSQPPEMQVFIAAVLAVLLGFLLSVGKRRATT